MRHYQYFAASKGTFSPSPHRYRPPASAYYEPGADAVGDFNAPTNFSWAVHLLRFP